MNVASTSHRSLLGFIAILWAGMMIGGSLIAAPAKFQVEELTMPVALLVGRAQFGSLAIAELVVIGIATGGSLLAKKWGHVDRYIIWTLFALAVSIFAVQHLVLMPILQERSAQIIAGKNASSGSLHLVYIAVECLKVVVLLFIGLIAKPSVGESRLRN